MFGFFGADKKQDSPAPQPQNTQPQKIIEKGNNIMALNIQRIKELISPVCKNYGIKHMYMFGSQARGDASAASDADFFLDSPGEIRSIIKLSGFRQDLEECLGIEVDIITALEKNSIFGKEVEKDMVSIYGSY